MRAIDLHTHSNCSDGSCTVRQLIDLAHEKGLSAIALTDHDTVSGVDEAVSYAAEHYPDLEVIPGVEISTDNEGKEIHMVGLYIDHHNEALVSRLQAFVDARIERNRQMCRRLTEEAGIPVSFDELMERYRGVITRAHYADYMLEKGYIKNREEAFERYIGDNSPYYVPKVMIAPEEAVDYILKAGGVPILAHPVLYKMGDEKLEALVARLKYAGLVGIEAIYSTYEPRDERRIKALAEKYDLLISGGSDFHGRNKPKIDLGVGYGKMFVPEDILPPIKAAAGK